MIKEELYMNGNRHYNEFFRPTPDTINQLQRGGKTGKEVYQFGGAVWFILHINHTGCKTRHLKIVSFETILELKKDFAEKMGKDLWVEFITLQPGCNCSFYLTNNIDTSVSITSLGYKFTQFS